MSIKSHRDLVVWQKAKLLVIKVYELVRLLPKHELYGLSSQLSRAAVSVPCNIAEGHGRNTRRDYGHFVGMAYGSLMEVDTLLELTCDLGYLSKEQVEAALLLEQEVGRMLITLRIRLQSQP